jgi:histidinol-phosphatase (PHP family)
MYRNSLTFTSNRNWSLVIGDWSLYNKAMLIDYHIHNHFSPDSETDMEALILRERELGVTHICITNHTEWFEEGEVGMFDPVEAVPRFTKTYEELRHLQPKYPDIQLGFGCEIQYEEKSLPKLAAFVGKLPFDFVLGSVHLVDGVQVAGGGDVTQLFTKMSEVEAYTKYFEDVLRLVEWGHIDSVAHFDVVKKSGFEYYGPFKPQKYKPLILKILQEMKARNMSMELNTGSMHRRCHELFPHPDILKWSLDIGIENYTLGSDAHEISEVGRHLEEAWSIAKEVGIKSLTTYKKRTPSA